MTTGSTRRVVATLAAVLLAVAAAGPGAASAATGSARAPRVPRPAQALGYALAAPGFQSYFRFQAIAGTNVRAQLTVLNTSQRPKMVLLAPADVGTASEGGLAFGQGTPMSTGRWLTLGLGRVTLAPGAATSVPFTVRVPRGAGPGDYFTSIVATTPQPAAVRRVGRRRLVLRLIPRLAMTVEVSVPGLRTHLMTVGGAGVQTQPSAIFLTLGLADPANTLIDDTSGVLTVTRGPRRVFSVPLALGPFVPRTSITLRMPWRGALRRGRYELFGVLRPAGERPIMFARSFTVGTRTIRAAAAAAHVDVIGGGGPSAAAEILVVTLAGLGLAGAGAGLVEHRRRMALLHPHVRLKPID